MYIHPCLRYLVFSTEQIAEDCCLTIAGSLVTSGSKLGLALEQSADSQFWSMKSDGRIYSKLKPNLVLDIKGKDHFLYFLCCVFLQLTKKLFFTFENDACTIINSKWSLTMCQPQCYTLYVRSLSHVIVIAAPRGLCYPSSPHFTAPKLGLRGVNQFGHNLTPIKCWGGIRTWANFKPFIITMLD